jgi:hypothetical protein
MMVQLDFVYIYRLPPPFSVVVYRHSTGCYDTFAVLDQADVG